MPTVTPILLVGAGNLGGAILKGWRGANAFPPGEIGVIDPHPSAEAEASGANLSPGAAWIGAARTVLLAVKPQLWRKVAETLSPRLHPEAVIVSVAAGVRTADLAQAFAGRRVARAMPTTAVAIGRGVAGVFAEDPTVRATTHALFDPIAETADVERETLIDAVTAAAGSAPAYLYAFVEALQAAGEGTGLTREAARALARAVVIGSAALLETSGEEPSDLRRKVTSPGGTTEAALDVLMGAEGIGPLMQRAVRAALERAKALGG